MAEPIEMPFELWARMGPRNRVLDGGPQMLRDVAMATNYGTKIVITGFVWTIATRQLLVMERVDWSANKKQILPTPWN